jgi:hypothetical protein
VPRAFYFSRLPFVAVAFHNFDNCGQSIDVKSLWVVVANAAHFYVVKKMRLFSLFFTLLILLAACTGLEIKKTILDKIPGAGADEMRIGVAPDRKCPPPKQLDPQGNCRQPWGR